MYKFSRLLINNIVITLIFIGCVLGVSLYSLPLFFDIEDEQHQRVIKTISSSVDIQFQSKDIQTDEIAKNIAKLLKQSTSYMSLVIKSKNSTILHSYSRKKTMPTLYFFLPKIKTIRIQLQNEHIYISYQIDYRQHLAFFLTLIIYISVMLTIFIFIMTWRKYVAQTELFNLISDKIKLDLSTLNQITPQQNDTNTTEKNSLVNIPELENGIAEIKTLMSEQVKNQYLLEKEVSKDNLTGLENRNNFIQFYEETIVKKSPVKFGVLLITRCSELQTINQVQGHNAGDAYIIKVSEIMTHVLVNRPAAKLFRLNGSDFATILPNEQLKTAEEYATNLTIKFNEYQLKSELESVAFTGLVYFDKSKSLGELLALVDTAVSIAQTHQTNAWYTQKDSSILVSDHNYSHQNWGQEIDSVIEEKRIKLLLQPIQPNGRNSKVYSEVLARFLNANGEVFPTASFIAMAEKLDKMVLLDKLIIETTIKEIIDKNMLLNSFGINISARSMNDDHFMVWLERKLLREPLAAQHLVFEITELGTQQNITNSKKLVDMLHRIGARVTVERFGLGMTSFKFFRELTPDYIKMDSSYTRHIDDDKSNQYFLRLMVDLAHRLGISILAESVESQEEKHTLESLFIDGCQGFYVGKPEPLV
jgi:diguanylate cyclase (GGDEF)-like protein